MVDKRKGMTVAKLDLEVDVSKKMVDDPSGIYFISYKIEWGRDGDFIYDHTVYCYRQHDMGISMLISKNGLQKKRIKKITLVAKKVIGESIAEQQPIEKWRITNESS